MIDYLAHYRVYVIRCWDEQSPSESTIRRFTFEISGTGQRFGFTRLEELMQAIECRLADDATAEPSNSLENPTP